MLTSSPGYHRPRRVVRVGANYDDEQIATTAAEVGSVQCDVVRAENRCFGFLFDLHDAEWRVQSNIYYSRDGIADTSAGI